MDVSDDPCRLAWGPTFLLPPCFLAAVILHQIDHLRAHRFARFQTAAIADHDQLAFLQPRKRSRRPCRSGCRSQRAGFRSGSTVLPHRPLLIAIRLIQRLHRQQQERLFLCSRLMVASHTCREPARGSDSAHPLPCAWCACLPHVHRKARHFSRERPVQGGNRDADGVAQMDKADVRIPELESPSERDRLARAAPAASPACWSSCRPASEFQDSQNAA